MITWLHYHFRIILEAIEIYMARVLGKHVDTVNVNINTGTAIDDKVKFKVYERNGWRYYVMSEPVIDKSEWLGG